MALFSTCIGGRYVDILDLRAGDIPFSTQPYASGSPLSDSLGDALFSAFKINTVHLTIPCHHGMACDIISHYTARRAS